MRIRFFLFFVFLCAIKANSQTIFGTIANANTKKTIYDANVIIKELSNPAKISEYTVVNNGSFLIKLKKEYKTILIEVKSYGFLTYTKIIKNPIVNKKYELQILLQKNNNQLNEVVIVAKKKFEIKKDTVIYNVSAYKDVNDRKIIDVITKLPGIDYDKETGQIKYLGKPVETVLLEGDNLFDHNYSIGTKNINVDMVKQVQAIENYSENQLLKGIEKGDKVVLNLILKEGKIDFSGDLSLSVGQFKGQKVASDVSSNVLSITKKYKSFAIFSQNNVGTNYSPFDYFNFNLNVEQLLEKNFFAQKIIPETQFSNTLGNERVNINNQYFANYNSIFKINKRLKVKTNLYYINDKITSNQLFENNYIINNNQFTTIDNTFIIKKPEQYRGDVEIKYNSSKNSLLEYDLRIRQENIATAKTIVSNNNNGFQTALKTDDFYLKQRLLYTQKISSKNVFQFLVNQATNNLGQTYQINPSVVNPGIYDSDTQKIIFKKTYLEAQATLLGSSKKGNKYSFSIGGFLDNNELQTNLFSTNGTATMHQNNGVNNVRYFKNKAYQIGSYYFRFGNWSFSPAYSLSYLNQKINNLENDTTQTTSNFIAEPSLGIQYSINKTSYLRANGGYNKTSNAERFLFLKQVLINNRITASNTPSLELQESINYGIHYSNNDLYHQFQMNMSVNYRKTTGNFFTNTTVNENIVQINYFYLPQNRNNLNFNHSVSKYIPFLESTLKLNTMYSISEYKNIVNNSALRNNKNKIFNGNLSIKTAFDGFIDFENTLDFLQSVSENENNNAFVNKSLSNNFIIKLKPSRRWSAVLSSNYFLPSIDNKAEEYIFLDASIRYKPKNEKIVFNFITKNLLNEDSFEQIQISDFSTSIYRINILPRYYLLSMRYNF